jgi:myo-inositol-1(or 4)-monophosphatase
LSGEYERFRRVAEATAFEAGEILRSYFGRVEAREKGPSDLITDADLASQRAIARHLARAFPDHTLLAEEEGATPDPMNPWRWVVDPLDGTVNFAHGLPLWCVSIALEHQGQLVVGVVHQPILGTTHSAALGSGTTVNDQPVRVSQVSALGASLISTGMPTEFAADSARQLAYFGRFSNGTHSVRRTGTSAWNLALVSSGACDVCYATSMYPWDAAAGVVLVREAGGQVSALDGRPFDLYKSGILATNGRVHAQALQALQAAWPGDNGPEPVD